MTRKPAGRPSLSARLHASYYDAVATLGPTRLPILNASLPYTAGINPDAFFDWSLSALIAGLAASLSDVPWTRP